MNHRYLTSVLLIAVLSATITSCTSEDKLTLSQVKIERSETAPAPVVTNKETDQKEMVAINPAAKTPNSFLGAMSSENELQRLLTLYDPKIETFQVDPSVKNKFETENGTGFCFQPDCFLKDDGTIAKDSVVISVKAFDNNLAFLSNSLSTKTTTGELLETGGMVHIKATLKDGTDLQLDENKPAAISFKVQTKERVEGMHAYYGDDGADGNIIWKEDRVKLVAEKPEWKRKNYDFHPNVMNYTDKLGGTPVEWVRKDQDSCLLDWLEEREIDWTPLGTFLMTNTHFFSFKISFKPDGTLNTLHAKNDIPADAAKQLKAIFESAPALDMSSMGNGGVGTEYEITISGATHEADELMRERWKKVVDEKNRKLREEEEKHNAELAAYWEKQRADAVIAKEQRKAEIAATRNDIIEDISSKELNNYVLEVTKLGWINCDRATRFLDIRKVDLLIADDQQYQTEKVIIVFENIRSMLLATRTEGGWLVTDVPANEPIRIVSIAFNGQQPVLADEPLILKKNEIRSLNYKSFTYADLEKAMSSQIESQGKRRKKPSV